MNHYELLMTLGIIALAYLTYINKNLNNKIKENCSFRPLSINNYSGFIQVEASLLDSGTSAWCRGESNVDKTCKFHYLCYNSLKDDFIFFHGTTSMASGLPQDRFSPALADLSSVPNHNTQYFNFVDLPLDAMESFDQIFLLRGNSFIFNRFNPANLMHVFHDDLLPLFHTLSENNYGDINSSDSRLLFFDGHAKLDHFHLYKLFSSQIPLLKSDLNKSGNSLVCFERAYIGLSNTTTWYQYGFQEPQGSVRNSEITARTILLFTDYLKAKLGIEKKEQSQSRLNGILIGRRTNRLILNEEHLVMALARDLHISVQLLHLEDTSIKEVIQRISSTDVLIGVHGSALILSMFLKKGALLVEIFPFAVNPKHYTPYKTLVSIPGLNVKYLAWRNMERENTVFHKSALAEFGGIDHLSAEDQNRILESSEVPLHLCCNDPEWLFRIYQDTVVDIQSFISAVRKSISEDLAEERDTPQMYPAKVNKVVCRKLMTVDVVKLEVNWQQPWNVKYLMSVIKEDIKYEVWIQQAFVDNTRAWILNTTGYTFEGEFLADSTYFVWVRCIINNRIGPFSDVTIC
ncbi:protein O-linked-mannose beta-1,4-N-acetylglucosaminyltransferase 2-like [Antedon mediterranea]|uniref:protein O-linked-mannose beta-1,4-N-acetylglucosaminyltransferase 2-like n=1 Tax=Antedon mediterranea TaxID=105859 RepID=UPI003AF431C6